MIKSHEMSPCGRSENRTAFTLIELLVVVAIIAILAAMLLPAIQKARQRGHIARCSSQLHQIGLMFFMYADDWGGYWAPAYQLGGPSWGDSWAYYFRVHYSSQEYTDVFYDNYDWPANGCAGYYVHYGYNFYLGDPVYGWPRVADVPQPDYRILALDAVWTKDNPVAGFYRNGDVTYVHNRHDKGLNFLYADGHVQYYKIDPVPTVDIFSDSNNPLYQPHFGRF